jgi:hopanoid biosynthesis associated RND transporter like protein HpnN
MQDSPRHRLLGIWSRLISRHPWGVLFLALISVIASSAITAARLTFQPDRNDLLSRDLSWNKTFIDWQTGFPGGYDLIIAVDCGAGGRGIASRALVDELGRDLQKLTPGQAAEPRVLQVIWGFDPQSLSPKLIRTLPRVEFDRRIAELRESATLLSSATLPAMIGKVTGELRKADKKEMTPAEQEGVARSLGGLEQLIASVAHRLESPGDANDLGVLAERGAAERWQYLESPNGKLLFLRITPAPQPGELNEYAAAIDAVRDTMARVALNHPGIDFGLTGVSVLENDETEAATVDTTIASIISFVLITAMLILAFHSWKTPLLAMFSLLVGLAWSYGFLTLTIGHLQVISVIFAPMLLGISDAYGVHLASKLELIRHNYPDDSDGFAAALQESFETMGPGILTGALTTAAAFATTLFTDFKGVAEMGAISAMGILLCLLAMFSVYPALLRLTKSRHKHIKPMEDRFIHFYKEKWSLPFSRHPRITLIIAAALTVFSLFAVSQMTYDYNLQKLFPRGFESVRWQNRIADDGGVSVWFGVSVCKDLAQARARTEKLRSLVDRQERLVAGVGGVGMLFPEDEATKVRILREMGSDEWMKPLHEQRPSNDSLRTGTPAGGAGVPSRTGLLAQLTILRAAMKASVPADAPGLIRDALDRLDASMLRAIAAIQKIEAAQQAARLDVLDAEFTRWKERTARRVHAALDTSPLTLDDLPPDLRHLYEDKQGRLLLEIHPNLGSDPQVQAEGPLSPLFLPRFVAGMESVDPDVTGPAPQIYRSGQLIKWSYLWAGIYALIAVFALVWLDFRRLDDALMSLVPVAVGFAVTFGVMWVLGMTVTPANIIVLPLMFGIGVDAGVHMLHRFRQDPVSRPLGLTEGTGKGITVTTLTTVVGFGTLMFASHRGIASLGFVLTIGILFSMFACWTVMPAMLELLRNRRAP